MNLLDLLPLLNTILLVYLIVDIQRRRRRAPPPATTETIKTTLSDKEGLILMWTAERDKHPKGSPKWTAYNNRLKDLRGD